MNDNKQKMLIRINECISFMRGKNEIDRIEFRKMLYIALSSGTTEINLSVNFLMDFLGKIVSGAKIETLLNEYKDNEKEVDDALWLISEVEKIIEEEKRLEMLQNSLLA